MRTLAPDELMALRDAVARLLADHSTEAHVRRTMETASGFDPALWAQLAEMGITGLLIDEQHGGSGAGPVEIERVMEEAGAALLCSPLLASCVLAAGMLAASGDADAQARLLPGIARGTTIATVALTGPRGTWTPEGVEVSANLRGSSWSLDGTANYVLHAQNAHVLLVVARTAGGMGLFEVDPSMGGVALHTLPTFDHTLRMSRIEFANAPARAIGRKGDGQDGEGGAGWAAAEAALDLARIALAGEQAGGARRTLEFTVEYAKTRIQFGRAIGSFQAIKHMAADLLLESESATSAARHAAQAHAAGAADAAQSISLAAFACADAFVKVTADAVQMHGGIAFTWEHPAHLYLRRARAAAQLFGGSAFYRERYIQQLGG
jgi:alkylation response protein AidB-like acyl-CoA dehydrogenase